MTTAAPDRLDAASPEPRRRRGRLPLQVRLLQAVGWLLVGAGAVVALYLVYSLLFTNLETNAAQADLAERWTAEVSGAAPAVEPRAAPAPLEPEPAGADEPNDPAEPVDATDGADAADSADASDAGPDEALPGEEPGSDAVLDPGAAQAVLEFVRPGSDRPIVRDEPLFVVAGVSPAALRHGPGHYPGTAGPGQAGNFAVAGHRTTYGAPFFSVDELVPGDEIHATGRDGVRHVYVVRGQRIVRPGDVWVVGPDPLGTGRPTLTLTSCHPRFSQAQRIVVFAELAP